MPVDPTTAATTAPTDGLGGDLGWILGVVFRAYVKAAEVATARLPGGPRGYQILAAAAQGDAGSQSAVASKLGIDRTVMTYLLDDLVAAELVERQPDPADRRSRRIMATEHGRAVLAEVERGLHHAESHLLGGLAPDECNELRRLLQRVALYANDLDPATDICQVVQELASTDRQQ